MIIRLINGGLGCIESFIDWLCEIFSSDEQQLVVTTDGIERFHSLNDVKPYDMNASWLCVGTSILTIALHVWIPQVLFYNAVKAIWPSTVSPDSLGLTITSSAFGLICLGIAVAYYLAKGILVHTPAAQSRMVEGTVVGNVIPRPFDDADGNISGLREYAGPGTKFKYFTQKADPTRLVKLETINLEFPPDMHTYYTSDEGVIIVVPRLSYKPLFGYGRLMNWFITPKEAREVLLRAKVQGFLTREIGARTYAEFKNQAFAKDFNSELRKKMKGLFGGKQALSDLELHLGLSTDDLELSDFSLTKRVERGLETDRIAEMQRKTTEDYFKLVGLDRFTSTDPQDLMKVATLKLQITQIVERMYNSNGKQQNIVVTGGGLGGTNRRMI